MGETLSTMIREWASLGGRPDMRMGPCLHYR